MPVLRPSLWVILLLLAACAPTRDVMRSPEAEKSALWSPCTRAQALMWEQEAKQQPDAAFQAARCYAVLARNGKTRAMRLENAAKGRTWAETAISKAPEDGTAHYLAAYLAGLEAENDTLRGLALVPVIERGALVAARLNPELDHGGPDRMLGELYLRAPGPPVSIGDLEKALVHYKRAIVQDPDFFENRLGLAEAYLEDEEPGPACDQLRKVLTCMPPCNGQELPWKQALDLMKRLCEMKTQTQDN